LDEGREVVVAVDFTQLECGPVVGGSGVGAAIELRGLNLRLTNDEAAILLALLEAEIGDWARERDSVRRAFERGEGSLSAEARAGYGLEAEDEGLDALDTDSARYAESLRESADFARKAERENR
jgi:hypothetical protein